MAKLVIQTQYAENYGEHDWDGKGACPEYWKFKGGNVYVVENITPAQQERIETAGIPMLSSLIEYSSIRSRELIVAVDVMADDAVVCEKWEAPYILSYENHQWTARRAIKNHGEYRLSIATKHERFDLEPQGDRQHYCAYYEMVDGRVLGHSELIAELAAQE